jgi:hypothetical protein
VVSAYVLSRFDERGEQVRDLISHAADEGERLVDRIVAESSDPLGEVID